MRFLNCASIDVKDLVGPLMVPRGAEEYSGESVETLGIYDCPVFLSLDVRAKGCNAVFGEVELATKDDFAGQVKF